MRRSIVARVVLVVLACLATASGALAQAEDRAGKTNKFTRKEIGQFFRDYPDMLKLVYKAMNLKRKAQGKTPRCCIGFSQEDCNMCVSLGDSEECSDICQ